MKSIGSTLLFFGFGTCGLDLIGYQFVILAWIDIWGDTMGWVIRISMIVAGCALFFFGQISEDAEEAEESWN